MKAKLENINGIDYLTFKPNEEITFYKLQLTHPSKITDAHCVELFDLLDKGNHFNHFNNNDKIKIVKNWLKPTEVSLLDKAETIISFLRRNKYAFQFEGVSIDEQVESGVVDLKD